MKKYTLAMTIFLISISFATLAQKSTWGIQGGATYSNLTIGTNDQSESGTYKPGFTVGITMDKSMGKSIYFQPAINYVQKGYKDKDNSNSKVTFSYLELPLNFVYRVKKESGFFLGGGPSIGWGIGGTSEFNGEKEKIDFGGDSNPDLFEIEANIITGYKFTKKLQASFNFNFGLTSLTDSKDVRVKNNYFGLRLGYFFN